MNANKSALVNDWVDPDDAPELTDEFFERADEFVGNVQIRRGRPKQDTTKQSTTLRLDPEVIAYFKKEGRGWQTRLNNVLKEYVESHS